MNELEFEKLKQFCAVLRNELGVTHAKLLYCSHIAEISRLIHSDLILDDSALNVVEEMIPVIKQIKDEKFGEAVREVAKRRAVFGLLLVVYASKNVCSDERERRNCVEKVISAVREVLSRR